MAHETASGNGWRCGDTNRSGLAQENPFASRYVRPGALPFLFSDALDVSDLIERLRSCNWCGSITGPHGSGKSTLLAELVDALRHRGCAVECVAVDQPASPEMRSLAAAGDGRPRLLLVDGYDLLPIWKRWWLRRCCRSGGVGLLVTSHRPIGLPVIMATSTSIPLAMRLAGRLAGAELAEECEEVVKESFSRHRGNLREVWFDLYDRYERCHRPARAW